MSKLHLDEKFIRALAEILDEKGLTEIEVSDRGQSIRLSRGTTAVAAAAPVMAQPIAAPEADVVGAEPPPAAAEQASSADHPGVVTSPMVGTAYLAPEPGAPEFIRVGDSVNEGQTILIIEAMKTMNSVAATHGGTVKEILIENEQPVEYGQPLVIIA